MSETRWAEIREERLNRLKKLSVRPNSMGLVIGAGVTAPSKVPMYGELVLRLLDRASKRKALAVQRKEVRRFIAHECARLKRGEGLSVSPGEIALFARSVLGETEDEFSAILQSCLYGRLDWWAERYKRYRREGQLPGKQIVQNQVFGANETLNAVLSFCAARADRPIARPYKSMQGYVTNGRVAGILTTNYDNLLEGAFHTKFRRPLLKPVVRPTSIEHTDRIPVYHIHGYVNFKIMDAPVWKDEYRAEDVVISEDDYFRVFYDPLGFGNYISMGFMRRVHCLFIGCSLKDQNLRRFLYHLAAKVSEAGGDRLRHFALLPQPEIEEGDGKRPHYERQQVEDRILREYGVEAIWIKPYKSYNEVPKVLKDIYTAAKSVSADDWDEAFRNRTGHN